MRRRASRRVSAAAGAAPEVAADTEVTVVEAAPVAEAAPAADAAAPAEAAPEKAAPKRATRSRKKVEPVEAAAEAPAEEAAAVEPKAPKTTAKAKTAASAKAAAAKTAEAAEAPVADAPAAEVAPDAPAEAPKKRATRSRKTAVAAEPEAVAATEAAPAEQPAEASAEAVKPVADAAPQDEAETPPARRTRRRASQATEQTEGDAQAPAEEPKSRGRGNQNGAKNDSAKADAAKGDSAKADASKTEADKQPQGEKQAQGDKHAQGDKSDNTKQESGSRSSRTRQRDRKRRGGDDLEMEIAEDDVLLPVAGILDVLDNYAFVRTSGYLPGVSDVYVALGQVKKYGLRRGDAIVGAIRQPREGDSGGRQKYNAIVKIDSVNGKSVEETEKRAEITEMTAIFPEQPLRFGTGNADGLGAKIDEHAPMGLGQRAIVALPATIPATRVLAELAAAVTANAPEVHLLLVLTNARPEEVTHLQRTVSGEVIAASFDRAAEDQATVAELAIDRASRLVELGHDVVVLLDSLTDLAHAYLQNQSGSRSTPEAVQALAVAQAKRLLGSARNLENGGSLTLLATARTHTGVAGDKDLLRELTPAANCFVKVSGSRTAPEVNAEKSYTISF